jgi:thiol-disulfide isomerase/thioredoxin/protocatechuate 3,4-dioxygenase beta subunit
MSEFCLRWLILALDVSLKALLLALVTGSAVWLLRIRRSNLKHAAWLGVLAGMIGLPWLTFILPSISIPIVLRTETEPAADRVGFVRHSSRTAGFDSEGKGNFGFSTEATRNSAGPGWGWSRPDSRITSPIDTDLASSKESAAPLPASSASRFVFSKWPVIAFTIWVLGVLAFGTRLVVALLITWQIVRRSTPIAVETVPWLKHPNSRARFGSARDRRLSLRERTSFRGAKGDFRRRPVIGHGYFARAGRAKLGFRESRDISVPLTTGVLHPQILLPSDWKTWPAEKLRDVLVHEFTHIRRHDCWTSLAAEVTASIYWLHPLSWWLRRRLAVLAEDCCDDVAISAAGDRAVYARHLLEIASMLCHERRRLHYVGLSMARQSNVERRILSILDGNRPLSRQLTRSATLLLLAVIVPVVAVAAALKPAGESSTDKDSHAKSEAPQSPTDKAGASPDRQSTSPDSTVSNARDSNDAAQAAAAGKVISGRVVDQEGKGVGGAKVWSFIEAKRGLLWLTDVDGTFKAVIPDDTRHVRLSAQHPDFVGADALWWAAAGQALKLPETVTINLKPGVAIGGIVRGEEAEPIENAQVKVEMSGDGESYVVDVRTDRDGRWRAHVPAKTRAKQFWLYHADYVCVPISRSTPPDEPLHALEAVSVMKRGKHVHGIVHDQRGKPIANAVVLTQPYNVDLNNPDDDLTTTRTRDDGSFAVRNMAEGPGGLAAYADGYAPQMVAINASDATPAVEIELSPEAELTGQIVDENGQGVGGVWIQAWQWQPEPSFPLDRQAHTDQDGRFRLTQLPRQGWFQLNYEKTGFLQMQREEVQASSEPCTLRIARPTTLHGQVLDDETGEPIKSFTVVRGTKWSREADMVFDQGYDYRKEAIQSDDGRFTVGLNHTVAMPPFPQVAIRVVARGYLPEQTEPISAGDQPAAVTLRLKRGQPITGLVIDASGQPAAHAQVAWVGRKRYAIIENGRINGGVWENATYRPEIILQTDDAGRFELPASRHDGLIVVVHERGYAQRRRSQHDASSPLQLTAWCRVEGRVLAGTKPMADVRIGLTPVDPKLNTQDSEVRWVIRQQTHVDGTFGFDFVPSIPFTAAWHRTLSSHTTEVGPKAGETVRIQIGGNGGTVTGQLKKPDGLKMEKFTDEFEVGIHCTQVVAYPAAEAGLKDDVRHNFVAELKSYGKFTVHDLPPGKYLLDVNVHAPVPPNSCGLPVDVAGAHTKFEVAGGPSNAPLDLGRIELDLVQGPQVGQIVPDLIGKTLAGEAFDLSKLRGKPVLLDFWATWCGPCKAATPEMKRLYEIYGRTGKMAFVGVDLDYGVEAAANYVADKGIAWPQFSTGSWGEENAVARQFAVTSVPSFWIVGADGTILARDVPLAELPKQLEAAVKMSKTSNTGRY